MKKKIMIVLCVFASCVGVYAQKDVKYHQAQTRIIEPLQDVYVRPLVVDLEIIKTDRQTYLPSWQYPDKDLTQMTVSDLEDAKKNAAYHAALADDADVIVAATFEIKNTEKGKGVYVIVRGYPAKYVNWRKVGSDPNTDDYKWLSNSLFEGLKIRKVTEGKNEKAQAVEKNN